MRNSACQPWAQSADVLRSSLWRLTASTRYAELPLLETQMITRAVLTTLLALLLTGAGAVASAQTPGAPQQAQSGSGTKTAKHHLVIQVSDAEPAKWNLALNNARSVQADLGRDN